MKQFLNSLKFSNRPLGTEDGSDGFVTSVITDTKSFPTQSPKSFSSGTVISIQSLVCTLWSAQYSLFNI